jgi:glycerophosphoryl diester phosphodiesterase
MEITSGSGPGRSSVTIVGHRGAPGYRPEHTVASYSLAARFGVDAVDVDLCPTRDGHLVARHEPEIGGTTDVALHPEFASRRTATVIDSTPTEGWFTFDFTLAELKTLRAVERIPATRPHNTLYDRREEILTLDEVLDLLDDLSRELGRRVGVLPEVKHSTFHRAIGLPVEPALVDTLRRRGLAADPHVIIQSFETATLEELGTQVGCPLLQLIDAAGGAPADLVAAGDRRTYDDLVTPAGLREIAGYATWIGPTKERVITATGTPTSLLADARAAGLRTMPYTFRNEDEFLPTPLRRGERPGGPPETAPRSTYGDAFAEYARYRALGVEGLFSDNGDTAIAAWDG